VFTGIIEGLGVVKAISSEKENVTFTISCDFVNELKVDQSVAHNGVCLTVESIGESHYTVTAIKETLGLTNLADWVLGDIVNLERCMLASGRFDGHVVQGHVDAVAICVRVEDQEGSFKINFALRTAHQGMIVKKGSITINGISLTVVDCTDNGFSVAIIPYTWEHTNLKTLRKGGFVNIEFDIIGKYVASMLAHRS
jgi:riboflavin synthase